MDLNRADSKLIQDSERRQVLAQFGIANAELLAVGTEAEVYDRGDGTLLKLYADAGRLAHLRTLQRLYETIDVGDAAIRMPQIHEIVQVGDLIAVIETRLEGEPLENVLGGLEGEALERAEGLYLDAVFALRTIAVRQVPETYLLFDEAGISRTAGQSFEAFYAGFLEQKIARVGRWFEGLVPGFGERAAGLVEAIRHGPATKLALVHGDFFPGNVLVDEGVTRINGVIDFGSFTLFGNYLLDVAGAFGFYRMYDAERRGIRERMLPRVLERLGEGERRGFYQFLLAHAILTCDLYAPEADPRGDGHFQWAAEIVGEEGYWRGAM